MPSATQFSASVNRNGFPFCPEKQDVSSYDFWTTLGGTQKGETATESEKSLSVVNAMQLYWNFYDCSFTSSASSPLGSASLSGIDDIDKEPRERTCLSSISKTASDSSSGGQSLSATYQVSLARYYDGSINDESNYVGIGIVPNSPFFNINGDTRGRATIEYKLGGVGTDPNTLPVGSFDTARDTGYITESNIPFVYEVAAGTRAGSPLSVDSTSCSAEDTPIGSSVSFSDLSLDFYTYS